MGIDRRRTLRSARRFVTCGVLCCLATHAAVAQNPAFPPDVVSMRATLRSADDNLRRPASGSYDVVALRVEFQSDTSRFTSGDGTFDGSLFDGLEPTVDPLPHDGSYFQAHLDFLSHYVDRVSDGIARVRTHLVPETVRLSKQMGDYAPTGPDSDADPELRKLASMIEEAWTLASEQSSFDMSEFDPSRTALILFHAGVGRDVELIGTTLDKTPQDLPSLYFDGRTLSRLLGAQPLTFNGFPVDHTLVLPRTETRRAMDFITGEPFLLELSINGLLAASFFNYLGVPDLFDTQTGESGIGPFGLMDTQGIFAYRGLFPPEPMAWTKSFLGWTVPHDLRDGDRETVSLRAASLPGSSESARALISGAEYFLIENRYRDPEQDGLTMRVWREGNVVEQHVENGDPDFNGFVVDGFIGGVVVSVDNYDWALPGGVDEDDNELNGGFLIWHVDERRLRAGLADNSVNVGTDDRAIDLEEADGAQDVGHPSAGPFGPQAELGSPFDFYYEGNPVSVLLPGGREVRLYENRFGPDTYPSSETNAGGPSFVVLDAFSAPGAEMSFEYRREASSGIEPSSMPELDPRTPAGEGEPDGGRSSFGLGSFVTCTADCTPFVYSAPSQSYFVPENGRAHRTYVAAPVVGRRVVSLEGSAVSGQRIVIRDVSAAPAGPPENVIELPDEIASFEPASPLVRTYVDGVEAYHVIEVGAARTYVVSASSTGVTTSSTPTENGAISLATRETSRGTELVVAGRTSVTGADADWSYAIDGEAVVGQAVFGDDPGGFLGAVPIVSSGEMLLLGSDGRVTTVDVEAEAARFGAEASDSLSEYPVLADLDEDGRLDVLSAYGSMLFAFTQGGAVLKNFPIRMPSRAAGQPLVARFGDSMGVVTAGANGYLYAFDVSARRRTIDGFPLEVGNAALATPAFLDPSTLIAVSEDGELKGWSIEGVSDVRWGRMYGTEGNGSYVRLQASGSPRPGEGGEALIDAEETYNWPNPIRNGATHLRVATNRDARVSIRIVDAAGQLVEDVEMGDVRSGIPEEVVWQAEVASGLYFARYRARTSDGEEETKLVKMAVMR